MVIWRVIADITSRVYDDFHFYEMGFGECFEGHCFLLPYLLLPVVQLCNLVFLYRTWANNIEKEGSLALIIRTTPAAHHFTNSDIYRQYNPLGGTHIYYLVYGDVPL